MEPAVNAVAPGSTGALNTQPKDSSARAEPAAEGEDSFSNMLEARVGAQQAGEQKAAPEEADKAGDPAAAAPQDPAALPATAPDPASVLAMLGLGAAAAVAAPVQSAAPAAAPGAAAAAPGANVRASAVAVGAAGVPAAAAHNTPVAASADSAPPIAAASVAAADAASDASAAILAAPGKDDSAVAPAAPATVASNADPGANAAQAQWPAPAATWNPAQGIGGAAPTATASAQQLPSVSVPARLGSPEWDGQFAQRVAWAAGERLQVAQVHINPPELGPVEIKLTLNDSQATLAFVSQHAPVREAIESALPRLREVLAASGIMLGQASVGDQPLARDSQTAWGGGGGRQGGDAPRYGSGGEGVPAAVIRSYRVGMLDVFA